MLNSAPLQRKRGSNQRKNNNNSFLSNDAIDIENF